jgi:hypothetical protein
MPLPRSFHFAVAGLERAIAEAHLAYQFGPNSYTYACLHSCLAAEEAVAVLRDVLEEQFEGGGR